MTGIRVEHHDHVAVLTIDRPEVRNAIDLHAANELAAHLADFAKDDGVWVVIVTGAGDRAFCAGQDLRSAGAAADRDRADSADGWAAASRNGFGGVSPSFPKPLIAAVNGYALGGGLELCLSCDLIIAEEHATFGLPEVKLGFIAAAGGVSRLSRRVPLVIASEIALAGDPVDAHFALRAGLINRVVPKGEGLGEALALARRICRGAPLAVQMSKAALRTSISAGEDDVIANVDPELFRRFRESADLAEGPRAFAEKREPQWTGR
jgi:enoyl-CoA hydratase/carnithine racemase